MERAERKGEQERRDSCERQLKKERERYSGWNSPLSLLFTETERVAGPLREGTLDWI